MDGLIPTHEERLPRPGTFRALPSFRVHLLAGMSARHAELRFMQKFGLRLLEARVVGVIGTFGALSLKEFCQESDIEKSHASKLIAKLVQRGLLQKFGDSNDQRAISVRLSPEGQSLHKQIYADAFDRNERWLSVLDAEERARFLSTIEKLVDRTREMLGVESQSPVPPEPARAVSLDLDHARRLHALLGELIDGAANAERGPA